MVPHNSYYVVEERPLRGMIKTLAFTNGAERLARKPSQENVKLWNLAFRNLRDVTVRSLPKIGRVRLLRELIPLRGKDTLPTDLLKTKTHSTNSGEKVDELESGFRITNDSLLYARSATAKSTQRLKFAGKIESNVSTSIA